MKVFNRVRRDAKEEVADRAVTRLAIIDGFDPGQYVARVRFQPDDKLSGWFPVMTPWRGNGWGLFCPPSYGDQVQVVFQDDDQGTATVCLRAYSNQARPLPVNPGEFWLVHQSGAFLKLTNDGKLLLNSSVELDVGNLGQPLHQLVTDALVSLFNGHTHGGVAPGSGNSGVPNQQMGQGQLTQTLKGN